MDKNAIKKYAVWARRELISRVSQRALYYGISEKDCGDLTADSINGQLLTESERRQRQSLIAKIKKDGYRQAMEAAAYTWFNRFSALRFMEVNGYLPSHVRVFTDEDNNFKPQILAEAIHLDIDGLDMEKVYEMKDANKTEELYKYLLITQCNALGAVLPGMFTRIEDYTMLLFPDNLLREGSVIEQMITLIPQEDWTDQVQIIGWLYQYYNSEKKDEVFAALKKNVKITKENIPAATQLFTPDWIVRYMVENSLGRLWVEGHPNDELKADWKYYLEEAEQEPAVEQQLTEIRKEYAALKPEDIRCIDPCMGSGHILVYMFDVLIQIYEAYGYNAREAAGLILQNNIYGLDIDDRAAQLAYFAVMMKARQYDRRFFKRGVQPHVYAIVESNDINSSTIEYFVDGRADLKKALESILTELHDAKEYGSILNVTPVDFAALYARFDEISEDISIFQNVALTELKPLVQVAEAMAQRYHGTITNPPYMGIRNMPDKMNERISALYPNSKYDLFSVMLERSSKFCVQHGMFSLITMHSWMNLASFEAQRDELLSKNLISMLHLGANAFGNDVGTIVQNTAFVFRNSSVAEYYGTYYRLTDYTDSSKKRDALLLNEHCYHIKQEEFAKIPRHPFCYWISDGAVSAFIKYNTLGKVANPRQGMASSDNNRFVRSWQEVDFTNIGFGARTADESKKTKCKWFPYNNGGGYRKWYGNNYDVVNWENDGMEVKQYAASLYKSYSRTIKSISEYFKIGATWNAIATSDNLSVRYFGNGYIFSNAGMAVFGDNIECIVAYMNSKVAAQFLQYISPTYNCNQGDIALLPIANEIFSDELKKYANKCIELCKDDWDRFEQSWDFRKHPLVKKTLYIKDAFTVWKRKTQERYTELMETEEKINQRLITIYALDREMNSKVNPEGITVCQADLSREIKSLISYAVGCMFGRYSLDVEGLAYAGGDWDSSKYATFPADKDNIIPICDDEYFDDDIVARFVQFIEIVYGKETLEENLRFIADALGGKGSSRDVIRNYFLNGFYTDHVKIYKKRPIYWLFNSGKKGGFKCLIYMHRYQQDTIARIRTDYVHEQQSRYRTTIADLEKRIAIASTSERVKLNKQLVKLQAQAAEIHAYEEKIHHLADQMIRIDLDDGVKVNYAKFADVLGKIK